MAVEQLITEHMETWTGAVLDKKAAGRGGGSKRELYGIQKLRALILDLATQGILVSQLESDEPASLLIQKLVARKDELIEEGKLKKQKQLPIIEETLPYQVPSSWQWARLGSVSNYGASDKLEATAAASNTWVLELEDVEKNTSKLIKRVRFSERKFRSSKNKFSPYDVIYGKLRPYLDKVLVADEAGVCTTEMVPISTFGFIEPNYLRLCLKSPRFIQYANDSTHGMNLPRMGTDKARLALIPVAPLAEQHRIVAKVDELMALCDQLEQQQENSLNAHQTLVETLLNALTTATEREGFDTAWARIADHFHTLFTTPDSIQQLRQTLVQLAVMGKLVNQEQTNVPAAYQLEKIREAKLQSAEQGAFKLPKQLKGLTKIELEKLAIPTGWKATRLGEILRVINGRAYRKHEMLREGTPLLRVGNLFTSNEWYFTDLELEPDKYINKGDLIYAWSASFGPFIWSGEKVVYHYHIWKLDLFDAGLSDKNYLRLFLESVTAEIKSSGKGIAMLHMTKDRMEKLPVLIPPLEEQHRIVSKVEELMALCDRLQAAVEAAQTTRLELADAVAQQAVAA